MMRTRLPTRQATPEAGDGPPKHDGSQRPGASRPRLAASVKHAAELREMRRELSVDDEGHP